MPCGGAQAAPPSAGLFRAQFRKAWETAAPDDTRLIEIADLTGDRKSAVLFLTAPPLRAPLGRTLVAARWTGFKFERFAETDLYGTPIDTLLAGDLHAPPVKQATDTVARPAPQAPRRLVFAGSALYRIAGSRFVKMFDGPADIRRAIVPEGSPMALLSGIDGAGGVYEVGETDVHPSLIKLGARDGGYVRFGLGTWEYPAADRLNNVGPVRFVQSVWTKDARWLVGVTRGTAVAARPDAGGERIAVYMPDSRHRDASFWSLQSGDFEEAWVSDPLNEHVLDVRVGDPTDSGHLGVLVLTGNPAVHTRTLSYFQLSQGGLPLR